MVKLGRIYNAVEPGGFLIIPLTKDKTTLYYDTVWALMYHWEKEMWYVDDFEYEAFFGQHYSLQFTPRELKKIPKHTKEMSSLIRHQAFRRIFR